MKNIVLEKQELAREGKENGTSQILKAEDRKDDGQEKSEDARSVKQRNDGSMIVMQGKKNNNEEQ